MKLFKPHSRYIAALPLLLSFTLSSCSVFQSDSVYSNSMDNEDYFCTFDLIEHRGPKTANSSSGEGLSIAEMLLGRGVGKSNQYRAQARYDKAVFEDKDYFYEGLDLGLTFNNKRRYAMSKQQDRNIFWNQARELRQIYIDYQYDTEMETKNIKNNDNKPSRSMYFELKNLETEQHVRRLYNRY